MQDSPLRDRPKVETLLDNGRTSATLVLYSCGILKRKRPARISVRLCFSTLYPKLQHLTGIAPIGIVTEPSHFDCENGRTQRKLVGKLVGARPLGAAAIRFGSGEHRQLFGQVAQGPDKETSAVWYTRRVELCLSTTQKKKRGRGCSTSHLTDSLPSKTHGFISLSTWTV